MKRDLERPNNLTKADIQRLRERYAPWMLNPPKPELPIEELVDQHTAWKLLRSLAKRRWLRGKTKKL